MLKPGKTYAEVFDTFQWEIPKYYNIGVDICDRWATQPTRLALVVGWFAQAPSERVPTLHVLCQLFGAYIPPLVDDPRRSPPKSLFR